MIRIGLLSLVLIFTRFAFAQSSAYPQQYFRHPLNIKMELVANFGEIRTNHWHMGLDIRTQQRIGLPVYASADGFISRILVEPGGFGQAIYIDHPNGFTTLYAHLHRFSPAIETYVQEQQYQKESWAINLNLSSDQFPVKKGQLIAYSGTTGGSQGPHVHFEIRDTKTENVLNPLLFRFPIPDGVAPSVSRLAMYDRNISTYEQKPQLLSLQRSGNNYSVRDIRVGTDKISFAVGAVDRFTGTPNPNGIYSAKIYVDDQFISGFELDDISYSDSRYINAQLDYPHKSRGGGDLQHISPLPGAREVAYQFSNEDGFIHLNDEKVHQVRIEVRDAAKNLSTIRFRVQYDPALIKSGQVKDEQYFQPGQVNVFETEGFEIFTTEKTMYDAVRVDFSSLSSSSSHAVSPIYNFLSASIPAHDAVTVRIMPQNLDPADINRVIIQNKSGSRTYVSKAELNPDGKLMAKFRQYGSFQAFVDREPPTVNNPASDLSRATRIVFTPKDNFNVIKNFRVELNGKWLRFTNDKGKTWIYHFDEKFPRGEHELKLTMQDEAGNVTEKVWKVKR